MMRQRIQSIIFFCYETKENEIGYKSPREYRYDFQLNTKWRKLYLMGGMTGVLKIKSCV